MTRTGLAQCAHTATVWAECFVVSHVFCLLMFLCNVVNKLWPPFTINNWSLLEWRMITLILKLQSALLVTLLSSVTAVKSHEETTGRCNCCVEPHRNCRWVHQLLFQLAPAGRRAPDLLSWRSRRCGALIPRGRRIGIGGRIPTCDLLLSFGCRPQVSVTNKPTSWRTTWVCLLKYTHQV
jgi:hypothetical protein